MHTRISVVLLFALLFSSPLFASSIVRINEVAPDEGSFDWVELYVATDSINLSSWTVHAGQSASVIQMKKLPQITTGWAYIVIHCTSTASPPLDEDDGTGDTNENGFWDVYIASNIFSGMQATDNVVVLKDSNSVIIDGMVFTNRSGAWTGDMDEYKVLVSTGQWSGPADPVDGDADDEVKVENAAALCSSWGSLGRYPDGTDTDGASNWIAKNDWGRYTDSIKTPGTANGQPYNNDWDPPAGITDLEVTGQTTGSITLQWTAPDEDGSAPSGSPATRYVVRYATYSISTQQDFWEVTDFVNSWTPSTPGTTETQTVDGLQPGTTYWFIIEAEQDVTTNGNHIMAGLCNVPVSGLTDPDIQPPPAITGLTALAWNSTVGSVQLSWVAPADPPSNDSVIEYFIRYASFSLADVGGDTTTWWNSSADIYSDEPTPSSPGEIDSMVISGLASNTTLYFFIRSRDAQVSGVPNSPLSNGATEYVQPHLLISEVMHGEAGKSANEFVELYNPTDSSINLSGIGVKIKFVSSSNVTQNKTLVFTNTTIPSKGFFLFATTNPVLGVTRDASLPASGGLTNNSGVIITDSYDYVIDRVGWNTGPLDAIENTGFTAFGTGESIERKPGALDPGAGNAVDNDNNSQDFLLRTTPEPQNTSFTEPGSISMTVEIKPGVGVSSLTWSNVNLPDDDWKASDQYILLSVTSTWGNWGVQIYTNNKAVDANPQYTGSGNPVGLVAIDTTTFVLPLCWRLTDNTTDTYDIKEDPDDHHLYSQTLGSGFRCFFWMKDKNTGGDYPFTDGEDYVTVIDERGGHYAEGNNWGAMDNPNYIYIGAKFSNATYRTYKTNTLRIEAFYE